MKRLYHNRYDSKSHHGLRFGSNIREHREHRGRREEGLFPDTHSLCLPCNPGFFSTSAISVFSVVRFWASVKANTTFGQDRYLLALAHMAVRHDQVAEPKLKSSGQGKGSNVGFIPGGDPFIMLYWKLEDMHGSVTTPIPMATY